MRDLTYLTLQENVLMAACLMDMSTPVLVLAGDHSPPKQAFSVPTAPAHSYWVQEDTKVECGGIPQDAATGCVTVGKVWLQYNRLKAKKLFDGRFFTTVPALRKTFI